MRRGAAEVQPRLDPAPRLADGPAAFPEGFSMPAITLPDGSIRQFDGAVTGAEVAASIGPV
jgi:hypothetical protein